jgi:hypothetical protein
METYQKRALLDLDSIVWRKRNTFKIVLSIDTSSREYLTKLGPTVLCGSKSFPQRWTLHADLLLIQNHYWARRVNLNRKCDMHGQSLGDFLYSLMGGFPSSWKLGIRQSKSESQKVDMYWPSYTRFALFLHKSLCFYHNTRTKHTWKFGH